MCLIDKTYKFRGRTMCIMQYNILRMNGIDKKAKCYKLTICFTVNNDLLPRSDCSVNILLIRLLFKC